MIEISEETTNIEVIDNTLGVEVEETQNSVVEIDRDNIINLEIVESKNVVETNQVIQTVVIEELTPSVIEINTGFKGDKGDITEVIQIDNEEKITLSEDDITNKYIDLEFIPATPSSVSLFPNGGIKQLYGTDYEVVTDGTDIKRLSWNGLNLQNILEANDIIIINYLYIKEEI